MNTTTMNLKDAGQVTPATGARFNLSHTLSVIWHALVPSRDVDVSEDRDVRKARDLANRWQEHDPRVAAELSAAIDRYEAQHGQ